MDLPSASNSLNPSMPPQSPENSVDDILNAYQETDDFNINNFETDESDCYWSSDSENDYLDELIGNCHLDSIIGKEPSCSTEDEKLIYPNARITNIVSI